MRCRALAPIMVGRGKKYPIVEKGGKNRSETRAYQRNDRRGGRNLQRGPRDNGANRFPYMRTRCLRCGEEGHRTVGCWRPRKLFCYHCGKEGAPCSPNFQHSSDQPNRSRSSNLPQHVVICQSTSVIPSSSSYSFPGQQQHGS
ncbi:hypothetical protein JTB14_013024 [Gonioctena quinquepunctata]|nr:hypothetical protein JTB14_013024 [Gonioctena quinquepunctata]